MLLFTQPLCLSLAAEENGMRTPTVYIVGQGYELVDNAGNTIYNITATLPSDTYIQDQAKKLVPLLAAGILTQRFERFSSALLEAIADAQAVLENITAAAMTKVRNKDLNIDVTSILLLLLLPLCTIHGYVHFNKKTAIQIHTFINNL